jgi:hypothetical protein
MGQKFVIEDDYIPVNNYTLTPVGLPPIPFTSVGALEKEIVWIELPDKTQQSSGRANPGEVEVKVPVHHPAAVAAMEAWADEGQDPIQPGYKKSANLNFYSGSLLRQFNVTMLGVGVCKGTTPEAEMANDGDMAELSYTLKWDHLFGIAGSK